jgi:hypothetical protein
VVSTPTYSTGIDRRQQLPRAVPEDIRRVRTDPYPILQRRIFRHRGTSPDDSWIHHLDCFIGRMELTRSRSWAALQAYPVSHASNLHRTRCIQPDSVRS